MGSSSIAVASATVIHIPVWSVAARPAPDTQAHGPAIHTSQPNSRLAAPELQLQMLPMFVLSASLA